MSFKDWSPFNEMVNFRKSKDQALNHSPFSLDGDKANPKVDVYQTNSEVIVKAEVPGISKEDIDVYVDEKSVRLSGKTQKHTTVKDRNAYSSQTSSQSFSRTIHLPSDINIDHARAEFRDGILSITAPKVHPPGTQEEGMNLQ